MSECISEDYICTRLMLREQSELIYQSIENTGDKQFSLVLKQLMAKYSLHELRMILIGYFQNFEVHENSPWLLLFSSKNYLSKLQIMMKMFGKYLSIHTMGINSLFESLHPLTVSLTADLNVLSAVIERIPNLTGAIITQSAQLLRDAIDWKSNEQLVPVLDYLKKKMVDLNAKSSIRGECALIYATRTERKLTVLWLIEHNVDLNLQDNYGFTALHYAAISKEISCVDLLHAGANPNIQSNNGATALLLIFTINSVLFYSSGILPKEMAIKKPVLRISIDNSLVKEFSKFGAKIIFASSQQQPRYKLSVLNIQTVTAQQRISRELEVTVPILVNNFDNFVNIDFLDGMQYTYRNNTIKIKHGKLLCTTVKHGFPVEELRSKTTDSYDSLSNITRTMDYFLRYFQKPYPAFVFCSLIRFIEKFIGSLFEKSVAQSDYIINTIIEVGSNFHNSHNCLSLYYKSICLILQLLTFYPQIEDSLIIRICGYLEVRIVPYWYNLMQATKGDNNPNNFLCIQIGTWMSLFMYIWRKSMVSEYEPAYKMFEKFYQKISRLCEEFQPLICMTLYATIKYYTCDGKSDYEADPDSNRYIGTISKCYCNFIQETISLLITLGEDINSVTFYLKQTALLIAVQSNGNEKFIRFLLEQGASPYAVDALGYSIKEYCDVGIVKSSLHALVNKITEKPYPLQLLCVKNLAVHQISVRNLLAHKALRKYFIVHT